METHRMCWAVALVTLLWTPATRSNALDDYVNAPDDVVSYRYLTTYTAPGVEVHALNITTQQWLTDKDSSCSVWHHQLFIAIPTTLLYTDSAALYIGAGNNGDKLATLSNTDVSLVTNFAVATGSVAAVIRQVPNQPIVFPDDPSQMSRTEDNIIAWTWKSFLENSSNPDIVLLLPMTKSAVKAMDIVSDYVRNRTGNNIDKYMVSGGSKRGWTTWLTAAVDKRVIAIAPIVFDLLNMHANLHHHYRSLGGWTFAFLPYFLAQVTSRLDDPNFPLFQAIADPFSYNSRLTMPKLIISSADDQFFLLDDSHYFFDRLTGPKYMRIFPNADHGGTKKESDYINTLASFYLSVVDKVQLPNVTWTLAQTGYGGKINVRTSQVPSNVTVFYAQTADDKRRDFRIQVIDLLSGLRSNPVFWSPLEASKLSDLEYEADVTRPPTGWAAFFIELTFPGPRNTSLVFTTEANIIPDIYAFPACSGSDCFGTLV